MTVMREHGTDARYRYGPDENDQPGQGCRCTRCTAAATKAVNLCRLRAAEGRTRRLVDAIPARSHVQALHDEHGLPYVLIARLAGVAELTLYRLLHGEPSKGKPPKPRIFDETEAAILAVHPEHARGLRIPIVGTQRRLQALAWAGWPTTHLAPRMDLANDHLLRLMHGRGSPTVYARTARAVATVTAQLWDQDPTRAGVSPQKAAQVRTIAARRGYAPYAAWDDIDNPKARPRGMRRETAS